MRAYTAQLVQNHANLTWSIEGGRTRTGKLRPPVFGILRYITDAVDEIDGPEVYLVPTSIVYDQLHEVEAMTTEAYGATKRPEDFRFLVRLARQQGERLGRAYLDFGEPLPLRKRLEELRAEESGTGTEIERIALDVEHRINRATPVTPTAVVSLALLGADRSLSISEVLATVRPLASYIAARNWKVAGAADLTNRSTIRGPAQLVASGGVQRRTTRAPSRSGGSATTSTWSPRSTATPPSTSSSSAPSARRHCWPPLRTPRVRWTGWCNRRPRAMRR